MNTQAEARSKAHIQDVKLPKRGKGRQLPRIMAAICMQRSLYRRMQQRAAVEGLSFGTWIKRAGIKELHRPPSI
jgi:hypothetical protein